MKNYLGRFGFRLIGAIVVLAIGGGIYLFSSEAGAEKAYDSFKEEYDNSGQEHIIEWADGRGETFYVTSDKEYGYVADYTDLTAVLNCSEGNELYIFNGNNITSEMGTICDDAVAALDETYSYSFKDFFSTSYEANYEEKDDYFEVTGSYEQGGSYTIKLYKSADKVVWEDSDYTYTINLTDNIVLPTE